MFVSDKFLLVDADGAYARFAVVEAGEPPATVEAMSTTGLATLILAIAGSFLSRWRACDSLAHRAKERRGRRAYRLLRAGGKAEVASNR